MRMCICAIAAGILTFALLLTVCLGTVAAPDTAGNLWQTLASASPAWAPSF